MELYAAEAGASWHPLTGMLTFESSAATRAVRDVYGAPAIALSEGWGYSDLLHEATHLWCTQSTRLGIALSAAATVLWERWIEGGRAPVAVPLDITVLLAAFEPLLEGLALYGQLDYEADNNAPLWSPLPSVTEITEIRYRNLQMSLRALMRAHREEALAESVKPVGGTVEHPSLLELLFRRDNDRTVHYFAGYLYVKALAAALGRVLPAARGPEVFLPLAIKLLCDHPVVAKRRRTSVAEILGELHRDVAERDPRTWEGIGQLLSRADAAERFRHWDVYGQIRSGQFDEWVSFDDEALLDEFALGRDEALGRFSDVRSAVWILLVWWRRGVLELTDGNVQLRGLSGDIPVHVPPWGSWASRLAVEHPELRAAAAFTVAKEHGFRARAAKLRDKEVTIAMFVTLSTGTPGLALWQHSDDAVWYPFLGDALIAPDLDPTVEVAIIDQGLRLDPADRDAFGRSLITAAGTADRVDAARWLFSQLVLPDAVCDLPLRFAGPGFLAAADALASWIRPSPLRRLPHVSDPVLREAGEAVFRFPGFSSCIPPLAFGELLPSLPPPYG